MSEVAPRDRRRLHGEPDALGREPGPPLGRRIAALRAERGWTQQELASRVAVSRVAVSHVEAGLTEPGERTVAMLAGVFGMEPHELVTGTNYPHAKAERLPLVVARHTEVDHQLGVLEADLAWIEAVRAAAGGDQELARRAAVTLERWTAALGTLEEATFEPGERARVAAARRRVAAERSR